RPLAPPTSPPVPYTTLFRSTTDVATAATWFERFEGAGLDGVVAKRLDGPYRPGERTMVKVKHQRTADCVVAGFRWHKDGKGVGRSEEHTSELQSRENLVCRL